jgi:hypothetical protein
MEKLVICPLCRSYVLQCNQCHGPLTDGEEVICVDEGNAHVCSGCIEDYFRDQHMTDFVILEEEVELK